jgi:uncharacterized membrane protein YphA (DoxX/SURF4 family)
MTSATSARGRAYWIRTICYWLFTLIAAYEMTAGSMWDLLRIEYVRVIFAHLGYPLYLLSILGAWKLLCGLVFLIPRFVRLKEWAYAGAIFNYTGAFASHVSVGDGPGKWLWPLAFAAVTLGSWALRPPERRIPRAGPAADTRPIAWVVPIAIFVVLLARTPNGLPAAGRSFPDQPERTDHP